MRENNTGFKIRCVDEEVNFGERVCTQRIKLGIIKSFCRFTRVLIDFYYGFTRTSNIYNIIGPIDVNNWYYAVIKIKKIQLFFQYSQATFKLLSFWIWTLLG